MTSPKRWLLAAPLAIAVAACGFFIWAEWNSSGFGSAGDSKPSGTSTCRNNLFQLFKGMHIYQQSFGKGRDLPPHRGEAFWKCLAGKCGDTSDHSESYFKRAPLAGDPDALICPKNTKGDPPGTISFRGPTGATRSDMQNGACPPGQVIGCEKPDHHRNPGGWVLRFDGTTAFMTGEEYEAALRQTE